MFFCCSLVTSELAWLWFEVWTPQNTSFVCTRTTKWSIQIMEGGWVWGRGSPKTHTHTTIPPPNNNNTTTTKHNNKKHKLKTLLAAIQDEEVWPHNFSFQIVWVERLFGMLVLVKVCEIWMERVLYVGTYETKCAVGHLYSVVGVELNLELQGAYHGWRSSSQNNAADNSILHFNVALVFLLTSVSVVWHSPSQGQCVQGSCISEMDSSSGKGHCVP